MVIIMLKVCKNLSFEWKSPIMLQNILVTLRRKIVGMGFDIQIETGVDSIHQSGFKKTNSRHIKTSHSSKKKYQLRVCQLVYNLFSIFFENTLNNSVSV